MNRIFLIGRLTKEPEKVATKDKLLCKMAIAVNENFTDENGKRPVQFFNIVVWNKRAETCLKYLTKGSLIAVEGNLHTREWENDKGEKKHAVEVVASEVEFLSVKKKDEVNDEFEPIGITPISDDGLPF